MPTERIFQAILLALSLWGYVQLLSCKIKPEFAIGVVFSAIGSIMFFAGIADIMPLAANAIIACGIVCLAICLIKRISIKNIITPGTVFFALLCLFFVYILHGQIFIEQDNFTHWAVVSRVLIREDRFPLPTDSNIWFPSYPLGSSSFIYFICSALKGDSEWLQMLAQAMLMCGTTCSLFAFAKDLKGYILSAATVLFSLCCNIEFTELLVDTLLPAVAVGAVAFCIYYKDELSDKLFYTIPYLIFLMSIKNSGVFFVAVVICYCLVFTQKTPRSIAKLAVCIAAPVFTLLLWQNRVKLLFENGLTTKHSMTFENFSQVFGDKTAEDVNTIVSAFGSEMFSLSNRFIFIILLLSVLLVANHLVLKTPDRYLNHICILSIITYIGYQLGNLGMYLFTMPTVEAVGLACYDRYHKSVLLFIAAIVCAGVLRSNLFNAKRSGNTASWITGALAVAGLYMFLNPMFFMYSQQPILQENDRVKLMGLMERYDIPPKAGYVIILDDDYGKQMSFRHMARFTLDSEDVKARYLADLKEEEHLLNEYEYLIVFHQSDAVMEYVSEKFGKDIPQVINLFKTPALNLQT